jgi:hypothetical protein
MIEKRSVTNKTDVPAEETENSMKKYKMIIK